MTVHSKMAALREGTWYLPNKNVNILHSVLYLWWLGELGE